MAESAKVTSIDALRDFKAAVQQFAEEATVALSEATSDVQRTIWWVSHDQLANWQREFKKRTEKLAQAKADLYRAQLASNDTRTSAVVERKNLAAAQRRLDEAEEKIRAVKRWSQLLEREMLLFKAGCQQISGAVAGELPNATARMDRMIAALQSYVALQGPRSRTASAGTPEPGGEAETSATRTSDAKAEDES